MWRVLSKIISGVFSPLLIPTYMYATLIYSSYLAILPINSIVIFIGTLAFFTAIIPLVAIAWNKNNIENYNNKSSLYPFFITGVCYIFFTYILLKLGIPLWISSFMISGVVILFLLAILKKSYNISIHMAAFGAYLGTIFAIAKIQGNISSDFIALVFIIGGILGSSRAYLKRYTPGEIITGAMLGFVWCYFLAIILNTI